MKIIKLLFFGMFIIIILMSCSYNKSNESWKEIYVNFLEEKEASNFESHQLQLFYIYDINNDNIPELIVQQQYDNSINDYTVYTCKNNELIELLRLQPNDYGIYKFLISKDNRLYFQENKQDEKYSNEIYNELIFEKNQLIVKELAYIQVNYNDSENSFNYIIDDTMSVSKSEFEKYINVQCELYYSEITDYAINTIINEYAFYDDELSENIRSNPSICIFGVDLNVNYDNRRYYSYNIEQKIYTIIMINGTFIDIDNFSIKNNDILINNKLYTDKDYTIQYVTNNRNINIIALEQNTDGIKSKYDSERALEIVREEFDRSYKKDNTNIPGNVIGDNLSYYDMIGRYYLFYMSDPRYYILFNIYTGEIYESQYGLPVLDIQPGFGSLHWLYQ